MATTRLMPLHIGKGRNVNRAIRDIIGYVENPEKTEQGALVTGYACDPRTAGAEFLLAKREYRSRTGRVRGKDDVIAYHLRQSFFPGEITAEEANRIGRELARRFTHDDHAFIVATHTDKKHIHNHIIIHSINLNCDRKFRNFWGSTKALRRLNDTICVENGLSIVENPKPHGKSYHKWLGDQAKPTQRDDLRGVLDDVLAAKPASFDAFLIRLQAAGCELKHGKVLSLRLPGQKRFKRLDTLGEAYSETALRAIIAGTKVHTPRAKKATPIQTEKRINLLVDIQAKLQAGKGAGYAQWAKKFNLKQMAQTLNYLSENGLLDYDELQSKVTATTARTHALSDEIKGKEKRLSEIAVLKTHIANYIKTRDAYVGYRQAGYSKAYLARHEGDIQLHKAAKSAFDALGVKKLPTIKSLQAEYAMLLSEKKILYGEYRKSRDEMRELLTAKANVDRVVGKGKEVHRKQNEDKHIVHR